MDSDELTAIEGVLRSELGRFARWRPYDREPRSPMNFVLDRAEKHLATRLLVYWVEDSLPDVFCLRGFSQPVAVFSTRYTEHWADVRAVFANEIFSPEIKSQLVERLALRLIAEHSLGENDPELAVCAMLRSIDVSRGIVTLPNTVASLELEPIGPPYMACWFYGLAHELGHFTTVKPDGGWAAIVPDEDLRSTLEASLERLDLGRDLRDEILSGAAADPKGFILGYDTLRSEGVADVFATSLLFESTVELMRSLEERSEQGALPRSFRLGSFLSEMVISLNVLAFVDRCRRMAVHACSPVPRRRHRIEAVLHPVAVEVRLRMVRWYLEVAAAGFMFGSEPTREDQEKVSSMIDAVVDDLTAEIDAMEKGLAAAIGFVLDRRARPIFADALEQWQRTLRVDPRGGATDRMEVEQFCTLARSLGRWSPHFETLLATAKDPTTPFEMSLNGESLYWCPWVVGPDGFNSPFGLNTKHGFLILVFVSPDQLFESFREISAETLADGYTMQSTGLVAETEQQLRDAMALRLPLDARFQVVVEGSEDFDRYMAELVDGTIWPEPG